MKGDFERSLLESGNMIRSGYTALINNAGKLSALITFLVAILVTFTDVSFEEFSQEGFTGTLLLMLISSYLIFFSMESAGERLGFESEEFISENKRYLELCERIPPDSIAALRAFCIDYSKEELRYRQDTTLMAGGLSRKDFEEYLTGKEFNLKERRVFERVKKMRGHTLTPRELLSRVKAKGSELTNPEGAKLISLFIKMIPTTLCMIFTVSIILTAKDTLDAVSIIEGIIKLSSLPVIALRGYLSGYTYVSERLIPYVNLKSRLLEGFIGRLGEGNKFSCLN